MHFLERPALSGIFNLGTGRAQTFNDVAVATINACLRAEGQAALTLEEMRAQEHDRIHRVSRCAQGQVPELYRGRQSRCCAAPATRSLS